MRCKKRETGKRERGGEEDRNRKKKIRRKWRERETGKQI